MKIQGTLSHDVVKNGLHTIVRSMHFDGFKPKYVVGVGNGVVPALMLSSYLAVPMYSLDIDCSNGWMAEDAFGYDDIAPKNMLVVFDANVQGALPIWLKDDWQKSCLPNDPKWAEIWGKNVRFATIVNNTASNFQDMDYIGMNTEKAEVISFPWEKWWLY